MASLPLYDKVQELYTLTSTIPVEELQKCPYSVNNIVCEISTAASAVLTSLDDLIEDISDTIDGLTDDVKAMLKKFSIPKGFDMSKVLGKVPTADEMKAFLTKKLTDLGEAIGDAIKSLVDQVKSALSSLTATLACLGGTQSKAMLSIIEKASALIDEIRTLLKGGIEMPDLKKVIDGIKPECLTNPSSVSSMNASLEKALELLSNTDAQSQLIKQQEQGTRPTNQAAATTTNALAISTGNAVVKSSTELTSGVTVAKFMNKSKGGTSFDDYYNYAKTSGDADTMVGALYTNLYRQANLIDVLSNHPDFKGKKIEVYGGVDIDHPDGNINTGQKITYTIKQQDGNNSTATDVEAVQNLAMKTSLLYPYKSKIELEYFTNPTTQAIEAKVHVTVTDKKTTSYMTNTIKDGKVVSADKLTDVEGKYITNMSISQKSTANAESLSKMLTEVEQLQDQRTKLISLGSTSSDSRIVSIDIKISDLQNKIIIAKQNGDALKDSRKGQIKNSY